MQTCRMPCMSCIASSRCAELYSSRRPQSAGAIILAQEETIAFRAEANATSRSVDLTGGLCDRARRSASVVPARTSSKVVRGLAT